LRKISGLNPDSRNPALPSSGWLMRILGSIVASSTALVAA
jgi:hypothetical protein